LNILLILQMLLGAVMALYGASLFRSMPPLGGFVLGGLLGITLGGAMIPDQTFTGYIPFLVFLGSGIVGAVLAVPLQIVIVVLSGSVLGGLFGFIAGYIIHQQGIPSQVLAGALSIQGATDLQIWMMVIFAIVFALISIPYEHSMFYASTAFLGSMMITAALSGLGAGSYALLRNSIFLFFFFITLGLLGTIWQNYQTD
jgi:hypothetical protein